MNKKILLSALFLSAGNYGLFAADVDQQHPANSEHDQHPADAAHAELKENMNQIHGNVEKTVNDTKAQLDIITKSFAMVERNIESLQGHLDESVNHTGNLTEVTERITAKPTTPTAEHHEGPAAENHHEGSEGKHKDEKAETEIEEIY